jgi:chromosome segregation ATPase
MEMDMDNIELLKALKETLDANRDDLLARLETKIEDIKANQAKTDFVEDEMKQEIRAVQEHRKEEMKAHMTSVALHIEDTNDKFEAHQGTLVYRMDAHQKKV